MDYTGAAKGFWINFKYNIAQWVPGKTPVGVFLMAEGVFIILSIIGLVIYWKKNREARPRIFWPVLYCAIITPIAVYRGLWHYLFLHVAVGSVFLATLIGNWSIVRRWRAWPAIAIVLLLHLPSLIFAANSKIYDVRSYRTTVLPYHHAMSYLNPVQRIAIISRLGPKFRILYGVSPQWISGGEQFKDALTRLFVPVDSKEEMTDEWLKQHNIGAIIEPRGHGLHAVKVKNST